MRCFAALVLAGMSTYLLAAPFAFVSVSQPSERAVKVIDLADLSLEQTIANVGDEPSRLVFNADRTRIYLSSWRFNGASANQRGMVYAIDTRLRSVFAEAEVGRAQNRSIAISPDGQTVYAWNQTLVGSTLNLGLTLLDAETLSELTTRALPASCQNPGDLLAHPDGRVFLSGCSDGLRVFDPGTATISTVAGNFIVNRMLGISPDGGELYFASTNNVQIITPTTGETGVVAMDIATGTINPFAWNVIIPNGISLYPNNTRAHRMLQVHLPGDPPGQSSYLFTYLSAFGAAPMALARSESLAPLVGPRTREMIDFKNLGEVSAIGAYEQSSIALGGRFGFVQKLDLVTASGSFPISASGSPSALPGLDSLNDIAVLPYPPEVLFQNGFE